MAVVQSAKDADLLVTIRTSGEAASRTRYDAVRATILFCHGRVPPFGSFDNLVRAVFPSGLVDSDPFDALADGWELYQLERHADAPGRS